MNYFKEFFRKNIILISFYVIIGIITEFLNNFGISLFQKIIDRFSDGSLTIKSVLVYGMILLITYTLSYIDNYPDSKLRQGIFIFFKLKSLEKISKIDYQSYQNIGTGTLVQKIETGAMAGTNMLYGFWLKFIRELLPSVIFSLFFISQISLSIMYVVIAGYVVVFIISNLLLKILYKVKKRILDNEEKLNHFLVRGFMEMVVFRVNRRFVDELEKSNNARDKIVSSKIKMTLIHEAFFAIFAILIAVIKVGLIIYAWNSKSISVGAVVALIALLDNAYTPIAIFNVLFIQYKLDKTGFKRFGEFLNCPDDKMLSMGENIDCINGNISVEDISFSYGNRLILSSMKIKIRQGEKIALVGESGSGKSTFVKLLLGLLKPSSGDIFIDNHNLAKICLDSYYKNIAYISQDSPVFDGTLKENLVFDSLVEDNVIIDALNSVRLSNLINNLENGLDTQIGERGTMLSGGERQRLALARLWFENPAITILDEATASMDGETESLVLKEVLKQLQDKTVIAITHRLNAVKDFDRIIVFKNGCILDEGSFEQLMNSNEYFKSLYKAGKTES